MAAEVVVALEDGQVVLPVQLVRRHEAGDAATDDGDSHLPSSIADLPGAAGPDVREGAVRGAQLSRQSRPRPGLLSGPFEPP